MFGGTTGDYGGGNWTITRDNGIEESIDINDLRAVLGMEWGTVQRTGYRTAVRFPRDWLYQP